MKRRRIHIKNHANVIASLAMVFSYLAVNSRCVCIFHQPKMPVELNRLKGY